MTHLFTLYRIGIFLIMAVTINKYVIDPSFVTGASAGLLIDASGLINNPAVVESDAFAGVPIVVNKTATLISIDAIITNTPGLYDIKIDGDTFPNIIMVESKPRPNLRRINFKNSDSLMFFYNNDVINAGWFQYTLRNALTSEFMPAPIIAPSRLVAFTFQNENLNVNQDYRIYVNDVHVQTFNVTLSGADTADVRVLPSYINLKRGDLVGLRAGPNATVNASKALINFTLEYV